MVKNLSIFFSLKLKYKFHSLNIFISKNPGIFSAFSDPRPLFWVKSNNIISFYDSTDKNGTNWQNKYANKQILLNSNGKTFGALIVDTCNDKNCDGCCSRNSKSGYLISMEYYTVLRNLVGIDQANGTIDFEISN